MHKQGIRPPERYAISKRNGKIIMDLKAHFVNGPFKGSRKRWKVKTRGAK